MYYITAARNQVPVLFLIPKFQENECGEQGACQEYNNSELMTGAVSMAMIAKIVGTILYFIGWRLWAHKEAQNSSIPYSDDVKCGVVTNAVIADNESDDLELKEDLSNVKLSDVSL